MFLNFICSIQSFPSWTNICSSSNSHVAFPYFWQSPDIDPLHSGQHLFTPSYSLISIGVAIIIGYVMLSNYIKAMQVEYFEEQWKLLKEEKKFRKQEVKKSVKKNKKSKNKKE